MGEVVCVPTKGPIAVSAGMRSGTMLAAPQASTASVSNSGVGHVSALKLAQMCLLVVRWRTIGSAEAWVTVLRACVLMPNGPTTAVTLGSHACAGMPSIGSAETSLLRSWPSQLNTRDCALLHMLYCCSMPVGDVSYNSYFAVVLLLCKPNLQTLLVAPCCCKRLMRFVLLLEMLMSILRPPFISMVVIL